MPEETQQDRQKRLAKIWSLSRTEAGKTQDFMAKGLGVSPKTIRNWESGATSPDLFSAAEWFRILGINPLPYLFGYLSPELIDAIGSSDEDELIDRALTSLIKDSSTAEKKQLLYLMAGQHGSPWYALLQMFTAHCHTSLKSRVNAARTIVDNYEMEAASNELVCMDNIKPDLQMLNTAIEEGKKSVINGTKGYSL